MNKQTKLAMALSPIMMALTGIANAGTCTGPCAVNADGDPEIYLNNTAASGLDWEIETNGLGARLVFGAINGISEPFVIERAGSADTLYVGSGGNVGINNDTPFAPIDIKSTLPRIFMRDTTATTGKSARVTVNEDKFLLEDDSGTDQFVMELTGTTTNQLYLDASGAVAIQKANPSSGAAFEVGGNGDIFIENGTKDWSFNANGNSLWFRNGDNVISSASAPVRFGNNAPNYSLTVADSGNIGLGLFTASASLHIERADAAIIVEDTEVSASQVLLDLRKNGVPAFRLTNTGNNSIWDLTQKANKDFTISKSGSGGFEMVIQPDGDMFVRGDVTANSILLTSSRSAKTDFTALKEKEVMDKLKKLDVLEWRYKTGAKDDRHVGPMAEDFYALFNLGPDNKHVNPIDLASIALVAAKQLEKKTASLIEKNNELQRRLASLEKLVTNLASGDDVLATEGKKVALNKTLP